MKRALAVAAITVVLGLAGRADARSGGSFHHGFAGHHGFGGHPPPSHWHSNSHSHVFFGGAFFFDPFFFPYYYPYPSYYPYYAPYPAYPYPPPYDEGWGQPPPEAGGEPRAENAPPSEQAERPSYGLVQLRGVPDGAAVDLDGRFWLTAERLDERWLAVPDGEHTLAVRVHGSEPVERRVEVKPGKTSVVRFGPFRHQAG